MEKSTTQLHAIRDYVFHLFKNDTTGHDFYHMQRVAGLAKRIAIKEEADSFITESAAWLHDIGDKKLFANPHQAKKELEDFLIKINMEENIIKRIYDVMDSVSYSKGLMPDTLEGKIVQDADRLDAIGAIGIARVFAYGGTKNQLIFDVSSPENTSIQHFYDKLLKLKSLMNTQTAVELAEERHHFLESYLNQFFKEWEVTS